MTWLTCFRGHRRAIGHRCPECAKLREQRVPEGGRRLVRSPWTRYRWHMEAMRCRRQLERAFDLGASVDALYALWQDWKTAERIYWLVTEP